jgi:hypothetical protein
MSERYQRLPKQEVLAHLDDDDDDDHVQHHEESSPLGADGALASLVTTNSMDDTTTSHNNSNSIFRSSPWKAVPDRDEEEGGDVIRNTGSTVTAGSTTSSRRGSASASAPSAPTTSQLQVMLSRSNSSSGGEWDDDDSEWDDDDDVRRYHLDFEQLHNNLPLPGSAEFRHESLLSPDRLYHRFLELRTSARQRRAARLLTMPSESFHYKLHACLLTWCCDATDRGILLVVGLMTTWLLVGWAGSMSGTWWWAGVFLFVMRVTARRSFESLLDANRKRASRRQRINTSEAAAFELESNAVLSTPVVATPSPASTSASAGTTSAAWGESDPTTSLQQVV